MTLQEWNASIYVQACCVVFFLFYLLDIQQAWKRLATGVDRDRERRLDSEPKQRTRVLHKEVAHIVPQRVVEQVA